MEIITQYDFFLLPLYLFIFYLIVRKKSKKYESIGLRKTFVTAFVLRMAGSIFYCFLLQYYYGYGDSFGFYQGGNVIYKMIQQDITSVKYLFAPAKDIITAAKIMGLGDDIPVSMPNESNAFIMKLSAALSFFTFNKYMIISIFFGFFSFIGIWKLFYVFYQLNEKKNVKLLTFFVLYFPSLWFWGSGLLKEPVCVGVLGIIVYLFYKNFIEKKFSFRDMFVLLLLLVILTFVKNYITVILLASFLVAFIYKAIAKIKIVIFRIMVITMLLITIITLLITIDISPYIKVFVDDSVNQIHQFEKGYQAVQEDDERSRATITLSDIKPSLESILVNSPAVIGTCLFRPFFWESQKVIIFMASLEAFVTLLITVYVIGKTKLLWFFKYIFEDAVLLFCLIFSILFALVIGYTTFNFGTMIRYKIIFLPFYFFLMVSIYGRYQEDHGKKKLT